MSCRMKVVFPTEYWPISSTEGFASNSASESTFAGVSCYPAPRCWGGGVERGSEAAGQRRLW
jgi:hypothetical protein